MYCKKIPRLFSVLTPLREDSMALTFPGIPLQPSDRNGFIHLFPYSQLPNPNSLIPFPTPHPPSPPTSAWRATSGKTYPSCA